MLGPALDAVDAARRANPHSGAEAQPRAGSCVRSCEQGLARNRVWKRLELLFVALI